VRKLDDNNDGNEDSKRVFCATEVYEIFKKIPDETIEILGLDPIYS